MKDVASILDRMGIEIAPTDPEEIQQLAGVVGLTLCAGMAISHATDIRTAAEEKTACDSCASLETCANDIPGHRLIPRKGDKGALLSFALQKCQKRIQYEELTRSEELLASSRIPSYLRSKSFRGFDQAGNTEAAKVAMEVTRNKDRKGVVFYGPTGVGKTHLAAAILNNRIITGGTGIYATTPELMDDLRSAMRADRIEAARESILATDLLFLDDLGTENPTEFVVEELFKIVNGRLLRGKQIIATTNLEPSAFQERYAGVGGSRIISRLYEACEWVEMVGKDRRVQK